MAPEYAPSRYSTDAANSPREGYSTIRSMPSASIASRYDDGGKPSSHSRLYRSAQSPTATRR